jgi:hypothetical protein
MLTAEFFRMLLQVYLTGSRQFNTFGSHGATDFVAYRFFPTVQQCCTFLKQEKGESFKSCTSFEDWS